MDRGGPPPLLASNTVAVASPLADAAAEGPSADSSKAAAGGRDGPKRRHRVHAAGRRGLYDVRGIFHQGPQARQPQLDESGQLRGGGERRRRPELPHLYRAGRARRARPPREHEVPRQPSQVPHVHRFQREAQQRHDAGEEGAAMCGMSAISQLIFNQNLFTSLNSRTSTTARLT